jgi:hypothetical protein
VAQVERKGRRKPPLGSGERFEALENKLEARGVKDPGALTAFIDRKSLGKARFQELAAKGQRRALRNK